MATPQIYEKGTMFVDGILLSESMDFSVESNPQLQKIYTQQKGFAGVSPGAEETSISVNSAVPRVGFEVDYLNRAQGVKLVELVFYGHGKKSSSKGFIFNVKQTYGVNKEAQVSFDFTGTPIEESTF